MAWTPQPPLTREHDPIGPSNAPPGTVALRDLELARWKPAEYFDTPPSHDTSWDDLHRTSPGDVNMTSLAAHTGAIASDTPGSSIMEEDDGPDVDTPLEYARFHDLCRDYEMDYPLHSQLNPRPSQELYDDMEEPSNVLSWTCTDAVQQEVQESLNERLDVNKETATFLLEVLAVGKQIDSDGLAELRDVEYRPLRLELPVLPRDHEVEMIALRRRNDVRLASVEIEPFALDVEKGEGIAFARANINNKDRLDRSLASEKLDISKETLEFLRDLGDLSTGVDVDYAAGPYEAYKKGKTLRISPPLLPVTPPYSPGVPASEAMQIDMTSTPDDLIGKDAAAAEEKLLHDDEAINTTRADGQAYSAEEAAAAIDSYVAIPSSSSPLCRKRARNLRVEPPLTPRHDVGMASDESATSATTAKKMRLDPVLMALVPELNSAQSEKSNEVSCQEDNAFLQESIMREAGSVDQQLQTEELVEFDTTIRVKVPEIDPVQMQAPWKTYARDSQASHEVQPQKTLLQWTSKDLLKDLRKWGGVSKIERSLPWAPFSSYLASVNMDEEFDDGSLERYLSEMSFEDCPGDVNVKGLIATDDQLRLLRDDSDDEDIEPVVTDDDFSGDPVATEPQERYQQQDEQSTAVVPDMLDLLRQKQLDIASSNGIQPPAIAEAMPVQTTAALAMSSNMMQTDSLANFMHLRGKAPKPRIGSADQAREVNHSKNTKPADSAAQNVAPAAVMIPRASFPADLQNPGACAAVPEMKLGEHAHISIVASSTIITNRQLIRQLQTKLPGINFVERDTTVVARQQHGQVVHGEADITISPSTAAISTTLQKLKQKPLPGQTTFYGIRDRIASISPRYEHLTVLVSEGNNAVADESTVVRPLDQLDCKALADLTAWASALEADVRIVYIPGGQAEVASWLAATISHCGISDGSVTLLQDETMWERWLRVAGFNAFAAQAILGLLKLRDASSSSASDSLSSSMAMGLRSSMPFGLAAFVRMGVEERVERFAPVLGGDGVLRRLSRVIDGPWSAKAGDAAVSGGL
ncbi:hypothetical protein Q7P37_007046 [Cladosporium fusiforme]